MEARLKRRYLLREAKHYGSAIMVIHETDDGHIFDTWEHVTDLIWVGGRTTTGTVIACLVKLRIGFWCSALQNIRQAVLQYRKVFNQQHVEPRVRRVALNRGAEYLERYFRLIAFAAYLGSEAFDGIEGTTRVSAWRSVMEAIVKARNGSVWGKAPYLKCISFLVDEYPVYCMATPTISGAKEMLDYLDAKSKPAVTAQKVILTDLREEAVVYVNGVPFVLRELNKPVDTPSNMWESLVLWWTHGSRMKEDILAEIRQSGGRMLLHPRIPLTRERDALASDVDAIQYCQDDGIVLNMFPSLQGVTFLYHTPGFGGVAYAMAIICIRLGAGASFASKVPRPSFGPNTYAVTEENLHSRASSETALRMGEYADILNLMRVLIHGPQSKADVDFVIERCAGAGHIRDDILYYNREFEKFTDDDDEERAYLLDMGIKALRRYFFLITFRSYLYCTSPADMEFAAWMDARPELAHLFSPPIASIPQLCNVLFLLLCKLLSGRAASCSQLLSSFLCLEKLVLM
ncbi:Protein-tyrosine phosphatase-like [Sesbania bispinosa]|nr:Protein-tyrosine phosphatase-like [Sesbania bispinosa]